MKIEVREAMKPSVIVWDLETVPDLSGFAAANDLVDKLDVCRDGPRISRYCFPYGVWAEGI